MQVLLIPDLYESPQRWNHVVAALAAQGVTAEVFTYEPPRNEDVTDIVEELNQRLIDETGLVGYGIGGRIAIQLAARNPHHLAGTVVINTPAVPAPGLWSFVRKVYRFVTAPIRIFIPHFVRNQAAALLLKLLPVNPKKLLYRKIIADSQAPFLIKITDPLLLLWGENASKTKPRVAEEISEQLNEVDVAHDVQYVADAGDALHVTHPDVVANSALHLFRPH